MILKGRCPLSGSRCQLSVSRCPTISAKQETEYQHRHEDGKNAQALAE
jgi:hypothetical protein